MHRTCAILASPTWVPNRKSAAGKQGILLLQLDTVTPQQWRLNRTRPSANDTTTMGQGPVPYLGTYGKRDKL